MLRAQMGFGWGSVAGESVGGPKPLFHAIYDGIMTILSLDSVATVGDGNSEEVKMF
jgi:hypothetical protein